MLPSFGNVVIDPLVGEHNLSFPLHTPQLSKVLFDPITPSHPTFCRVEITAIKQMLRKPLFCQCTVQTLNQVEPELLKVMNNSSSLNNKRVDFISPFSA